MRRNLVSCSIYIRTASFIILIFLPVFFTNVYAQTNKFDSTVKLGNQGYRVVCDNKETDENEVSVSVIGLRINSRNPSFKITGKVRKVLTDDFNEDGFPDIAICVYSGTNSEMGTIVGIVYNNAEKNVSPAYFPDIFLDPKIREGYKGYDEFSSLTGALLRKFPVYTVNDTPGKPTGVTRTVQYKTVNENGRISFKVIRYFDVKG